MASSSIVNNSVISQMQAKTFFILDWLMSFSRWVNNNFNEVYQSRANAEL